MQHNKIEIYGARENNLKNIDVSIPKHQLVAVSGVSGSGKSTLIYDILFSEAQRQYLDSLSSYARRILPRYETADFGHIEGLAPCISINQGMFTGNPKSTVGTYTELYTHIRLLFSRLGETQLSAGTFSFNTPKGACPRCGGLGVAMSVDIKKLLDANKSLNDGAIQHKTWKVGSRYWNIIRAIEYFDMGKKIKDFSPEELDHLLFAKANSYQNQDAGYVQSFSYEGIVNRLIKRKTDERGLGAADYDSQFFTDGICPECHGIRLAEKPRSVKLGGQYTIGDFVNCELADIPALLDNLRLDGLEAELLFPIIRRQIESIASLGIGYLSLNRSISMVSGGEAQKLKLAKQLTSSLTDIIYILDEPTSGLHERDVRKLMNSLRNIVHRGNSVIIIEHDKFILRNSDYIIDIGPDAGAQGGRLMAAGQPQALGADPNSSMFGLMDGDRLVFADKPRIPKDFLPFSNVRVNNLKDVNVKIPRNCLTCLTGVSGSGKSSLSRYICAHTPKAVIMDQSPIGGTSRGNVGTYTGAFDAIRALYARETGQSASLFSFNSEGSCETCNGAGYIETDMHYLGNVRNICETCGGKRYKDHVLNYWYRGKNICDVLEMAVAEGIDFFTGHREIVEPLKILDSVGLGYINIGQPHNTLSGGEGQRLKLSQRLNQKGNSYIFDEPTRGLHSRDTDKIIKVLQLLADKGNTVIVIEHNLDVIAQADWVIDLGPEGGRKGGHVTYQGPVKGLLDCQESITGQCLREIMAPHLL